MAKHSNGKRAWQGVTREVVLPSGNVVLMRPVGFDILLRSGRVPDFLTPLVIKAFKGEGEMEVEELKDILGFFDLMDLCCELAFVSPTVAEIGLENIEFNDKAIAFQTLGKAPSWLDQFRPEPESRAGTGADEQSLSGATEPATEVA